MTAGDRILHERQYVVGGTFVYQRADGNTLVSTVAHRQFSGCLSKLLNELVVDTFLHENSIRAHAGLPGVAELADHGPFYGLIEIRIFENNEWRIAAQFH